MMVRIDRPIVFLTVLTVTAALSACSSVDGPDVDGPEPKDAESVGMVVSEPVPALPAAAPGVLASAANDDALTYVSLPPESFSGNGTGGITNLATQAWRGVTIVDGGFDPVAIPATVGDVLLITLNVPNQFEQLTSEVPAKKAPVVVRTSLPKGKVAVPLKVVPLIVFSEPVEPRTVTSETIKVLLGGQPVDGSLTLSAERLRVEFTPAEALAPHRTYTLVITTGVADLSGDPLEQEVALSFTTAPEGTIAFYRIDQQFLPTSFHGIYRMNLDGSDLVELVEDADDPAWSHDGSRIAFAAGGIWVMNADGTDKVPVYVDGRTGKWTGRPTWSPDGSRIAFDSERQGNFEIFVMKADGSNGARLTDNAAEDWTPAWSPDGSRIAFSSDREDGDYDIYVMNVDGSNVTKLTDDSAGEWSPAWSPDGSRIAFFHGQPGNAEIYVMNADGTGVVNLTNFPGGGDSHPTWSPDGSKIAFASWRRQRIPGDSPRDIYVMNADGSGVVRITASDRYRDVVPAWRP